MLAAMKGGGAALPTDDLWVDLNAASLSLTNGDVVTSAPNEGSLGGTFAGSGSPTWRAADGPGETPAFRFGTGGNVLISSLAASAFSFLHNGAPATSYVVTKITSANPGDSLAFLATRSTTGSAIGFCAMYGDRNATTENERLRALLGNPSNTINTTGAANDTLPFLAWHIAAWRYEVNGDGPDDLKGYVDGVEVLSAAQTAAVSSSDPATTLRIGLSIPGDIARVLIYGRAHTPAERAAVEAALAAQYGAFPQ